MFDGSKFDETTRVLINARQIMEERGLARFVFENCGRVCAQGAINIARGRHPFDDSVFRDAAVERLASAVRDDDVILDYADHHVRAGRRRTSQCASTRVAGFNNAQTSVKPVLALFDRAIGGHDDNV